MEFTVIKGATPRQVLDLLRQSTIDVRSMTHNEAFKRSMALLDIIKHRDRSVPETAAENEEYNALVDAYFRTVDQLKQNQQTKH